MTCVDIGGRQFIRMTSSSRSRWCRSPTTTRTWKREDSTLYCPCWGHAGNLWDFAPEQHARLIAAAEAAAEQYVAGTLDEMVGRSVRRAVSPGRLIQMHRDGLAVLDSLPQEIHRGLAESGYLAAILENTIKDGFGALETFLKAWFDLRPEVPLVYLAATLTGTAI